MAFGTGTSVCSKAWIMRYSRSTLCAVLERSRPGGLQPVLVQSMSSTGDHYNLLFPHNIFVSILSCEQVRRIRLSIAKLRRLQLGLVLYFVARRQRNVKYLFDIQRSLDLWNILFDVSLEFANVYLLPDFTGHRLILSRPFTNNSILHTS